MAKRVPNFIDAWTGAQMAKFKKFSDLAVRPARVVTKETAEPSAQAGILA